MIVAAVMGVSYEYFVHRHVADDFRELLVDHEKATESAFSSFRATTARDVLTLLGNIAEHSARIPTLYSPPRDALSEVVFASDDKFFERLIGSDAARAEAVDVLRQWIESPIIQLRFLATDMVGMLRLSELALRIRELAAERQKEWKSLSEIERGCVLNYWWAASRCEEPMYESLKTRLVEWSDPFVQRWIIFVARQMPDARLGHIIELFLRLRGTTVKREVLVAALESIETLHHAGIDMRHAIGRYQLVFERAKLWDEACAAVSAFPATVHAKRAFWRRR
jgi:hypothetical protein